jgi:hypothetical protein
MQPAAAVGNDGNATVRLIKGMNSEFIGPNGTVNNEQFWMKQVQDIPASQVCLLSKGLHVTRLMTMNSCSFTSSSIKDMKEPNRKGKRLQKEEPRNQERMMNKIWREVTYSHLLVAMKVMPRKQRFGK